jgi:hypothetical protein
LFLLPIRPINGTAKDNSVLIQCTISFAVHFSERT